jgi:hypothetical protein
MGAKKIVLYISQEDHREVLKNFKGEDLKITLEEAIGIASSPVC